MFAAFKPVYDVFYNFYILLVFAFQNKQNVFAKQIDLRGKEPEKGVLMSHTISDLRIPLAYEVRLAPITTYSTGDYISRTIQYSERECQIIQSTPQALSMLMWHVIHLILYSLHLPKIFRWEL